VIGESVAAARRRLARTLLARARSAAETAAGLLEGGSERAAALLGCEATLDGARTFLVLWGLDAGPDFAGTSALFDRQMIETGIVSPDLSTAVHRALRLSREIREGTPVDVYPARVQRLLDGAQQLLSEAEIVLAPLLEAPSRPRPDRPSVE